MNPPDSIPAKAQASSPGPAVCSSGKLAYAVMLLATVFLALTGLGTFLSGHAPMTGWVLMAHVAVAPVFALALAAVSLTWNPRPPLGGVESTRQLLARACLWLVLAGGLVMILTGVIPMLPLFGTEGQHLLYLTHRYAGLVLAIAALVYFTARK